MEQKQTAVEWLVNEINNQKCWADPTRLEIIIQQAKEMEKQQIVEAYRLGHIFHDTNDSNSAQEYYDTEYGKNTNDNTSV